MSERVEDIAYDIKNNIPEIIEVLQSREGLIERVDKLEKLNASLSEESRGNFESARYYKGELEGIRDHYNHAMRQNKLIDEDRIKLNTENHRYKQALKQLQKDLHDHEKYRGWIPKGIIYEIDIQIDEALKGASE